MKIAFVLDRYPSLTETFIGRDIAALRRQGLQIEIFALAAGEGAHTIPSASPTTSLWWRGVWEKMAGSERTLFFKELGAAWWRTLGTEAKDFDHIHAGWASHPTLIAWGAAQAAGLPWSFSGHARDIFVAGGDLAAKIHAARFATVCTHAAERFLHEVAPEDKHKIIYAAHGIEPRKIAFQTWLPPAVPQILAVGRMVEKKGFTVLLDALAILRAQNFAFEAQIVGDGPLRQTLAARRDKLALRDSVRLPGAISPPEVMAAMRKASCLVVPSLVAQDGDRDGLPNVVLEAAASGLPIVATHAGAIEEFVDTTTGRLCPPGNAEALAAAICAVTQDSAATQALCITARQRVETNYDADKNIAVFAQAFNMK